MVKWRRSAFSLQIQRASCPAEFPRQFRVCQTLNPANLLKARKIAAGQGHGPLVPCAMFGQPLLELGRTLFHRKLHVADVGASAFNRADRGLCGFGWVLAGCRDLLELLDGEELLVATWRLLSADYADGDLRLSNRPLQVD
jgi:hypothetical protein